VTLTEAIRRNEAISKDLSPFSVVLACGFTPMHMETFLQARLAEAMPGRQPLIRTGLYEDIPGTLDACQENPPQAVAIPLEWSDIDPRLGFRSSGAWTQQSLEDIVTAARHQLSRLSAAILALPKGIRVAISLPTLPLPPLFALPEGQSGAPEFLLHQSLTEFALAAGARPQTVFVGKQRLDSISPASSRHDLKSDCLLGLPYTTAHADLLSSQLAALLHPRPPRKGIITDLDNTFWKGIAGEIGPDQVSWDLQSKSQLHALYQKTLAALASRGVLVAIASKNEASVVEEALRRPDLLLSSNSIFPVEANWGPKSASIERILQTWNISADSVIFVDDSPLELAEAAASHPGLECLLFPTKDYSLGLKLLERLNDLCGKETVTEEDALRLESLRSNASFASLTRQGEEANPDAFLAGLDAHISLDFGAAEDPRVLELINKTNQFNLNGARYSEAEWRERILTGAVQVAAISYQDKFGPLGRIAVLAGTLNGDTLEVFSWVLSCRAFSRRIEHHVLSTLFQTFGVAEMQFDFLATAKNGPLRDFFASLIGSTPEGRIVLRQQQFHEASILLPHTVRVDRLNAAGKS
jgi:FkbH-like protein